MNLTLTKNFYTWMRTVLMQTSTNITAATTESEGHNSGLEVLGSFVDMNGTNQTRFGSGKQADPYSKGVVSLNVWRVNGSHVYRYPGYMWFGVGSNNTEATEDDYTLADYSIEVDYNSTCRAVSRALMTNEGNAKLTYNVVITAVNDITIGEIGMFKPFLPTTYSSVELTATYDVLFGRATFDTPIELKAGESATFQISVEI